MRRKSRVTPSCSRSVPEHPLQQRYFDPESNLSVALPCLFTCLARSQHELVSKYAVISQSRRRHMQSSLVSATRNLQQLYHK
ncbi:uncharacterized protein EI97DRAFT_251461 [Westerdykella ornata]|uniref:Uncharacterized protein n=1 Tax=Westerdykella ornata TaxID=318751 RepID=A0A6A6JPC0_WESOR|nr:uncharacterized protein EI97DRAFT_251461 [Westerdykella ornata]KAF2278372.1 hypothetical protein EI97DRAFT_251461 [Westerdykella ornata]